MIFKASNFRLKTLLLASVFLLAACQAEPPYKYRSHTFDRAYFSSPADIMHQRAENAPFDVQYIDTMVLHHQQAIDMSRMALRKSPSRNIRHLAQNIIDDQRYEIAEMQDAREDIAPDAPTAINMHMPGMDHMPMKDLQDAEGPGFDREFLHMMIDHHKGAIEMSDMALQMAETKWVKKKARQIQAKQSKEIRMMQNLLSRYG